MGPAGIAKHVATTPFLTGLEAPWIDDWRRRLEAVPLRGLECFAGAGLGLGGPALAHTSLERVVPSVVPLAYDPTGRLKGTAETLGARGTLP